MVLRAMGKKDAIAMTVTFSASSTPRKKMSGGTIAGLGSTRNISSDGMMVRYSASEAPNAKPTAMPKTAARANPQAIL